ncbi:hypothetical protein ABZ897_45740 [Nonomuraea sp. NPDC046802]|uniref:hypothetical protein n=1 Tax=Nonomuraea sp. NPDC046802 TaxID=3154919 RepID=UPI0033D5298E
MTATDPRPSGAPSPRRSRRAARRRGSGSRLLGVAAGLLLLSAAVGVQAIRLTPEELSAPLTYVGAKGDTVDAKRFTVRLNSFTAAKAIKMHTKTVSTDNLFLIVDASAKSSLKPYHLGQPVLLTADGRRFDATDRVDQSATLATKWIQPDIWAGGRFFFEVPASVLPEARVIFRLPPELLVEQYPPEVEVDLGLTEEGARKLAATPQDVYSTVEK